MKNIRLKDAKFGDIYITKNGIKMIFLEREYGDKYRFTYIHNGERFEDTYDEGGKLLSVESEWDIISKYSEEHLNSDELYQEAERIFEEKDYIVVLPTGMKDEWLCAYKCGFEDGYNLKHK